jgi:sporulation protein YlmC with PRC-barrel domain
MRNLAPKVAFIGLATFGMAGAVYAEATMGAGRSRALTTLPADAVTITNWYKQNLYDRSDSKLGEISDVLVSQGGKIEALIVSVGGFIGINEKDVALPFSAVSITDKNGRRYLMADETKDGLKGAPGFKYDGGKATWVLAEKQ